MKNRKSKKHAFTLIELLVVIAIIALLLSVLTPSLKKAKESARKVVCSTRQKQFGLAISMYADANAGKFVVWDWTEPREPGHWFSRLNPYLGQEGNPEEIGEFMRCPSGDAIKEFSKEVVYDYDSIDYGLQMLHNGATVNGSVVIYKPLKLVDIKNPSGLASVFDFYFKDVNTGAHRTDGGIHYNKWYGTVRDDANAEAYKEKIFRHDDGINTVYADLHIGYIKTPDWWTDMATPSSINWDTRPTTPATP